MPQKTLGGPIQEQADTFDIHKVELKTILESLPESIIQAAAGNLNDPILIEKMIIEWLKTALVPTVKMHIDEITQLAVDVSAELWGE